MIPLSKQESKYRIKFIQEHHYDKFGQKYLDEAKNMLSLSYKELYNNVKNGRTYMFMTVISANRMAKAMHEVGLSFKQATQYMQTLGQMRENAIKEKF